MSKKHKTAPTPDAAPVLATLSDAPALALAAVTALYTKVKDYAAFQLKRGSESFSVDLLISYPPSAAANRYNEYGKVPYADARPFMVYHPATCDLSVNPRVLAALPESGRIKHMSSTKTLAVMARPKVLMSPEIISDPFKVAETALQSIIDVLNSPTPRKGGGILQRTEGWKRDAKILTWDTKAKTFGDRVTKAVRAIVDAHLQSIGGADAWREQTDAAMHLVNISTKAPVTYTTLTCNGDPARQAAAKIAKQPKPPMHVSVQIPDGSVAFALAAWRCFVPNCGEPLVAKPKPGDADTSEKIKTDIKTLADDIGEGEVTPPPVTEPQPAAASV